MRSRSRSRAASTSALVAALALLAAAPAAAQDAAFATALSPAPAPALTLDLPVSTPLELVARNAALDPSASAPASASFARQESAPAASPEAAPAKRPGKRKALLYSLLLPGAGELSLGARGRAAGFFVAEGLIWTHYVWFQMAGRLRRDDYIEQAQLNAGVGTDSEEDSYWKLVGQYERSSGSGPGSYEEDVRRDARDLYPDDPAAQDAYVSENLPSGNQAWAWSSPDLQKAYRATRASSNRAFDRAKYSFAAAILNRLVSAVDTQILHRRLMKDGQARLDEGTRLLADATPDGGARLLLLRRF
ncbi:MAG: hypothetical protein AABZ94_09335 [Candidatus Eisenbacteria bacterium]